MTRIPKLASALVADEILSRVPILTSLRRIRSTCKKWKTLFKDETFTKRHLAQAAAATKREGEVLAVVLIKCRLSLMSINLHNHSVRVTANLISLDDSDKVDVTRVYHCDGLLLCITEDCTRLVVWNPYSGETRWIGVELPAHHTGIGPKHQERMWYNYALGYDKSTHKILRFFNLVPHESLHQIYDVNSNSWRVLDVTPDWEISRHIYGVSLKGNTYWYAQDRDSRENNPDFLLCFDFTAERFAPRMPLPFRSLVEDAVILSSVREEQLAALFQNGDTREMEIWVTTKIEPGAAMSWSMFFALDMRPLTRFPFYSGGSFLLIDEDEDEEKRGVVVFDACQTNRNTAYFIGANGCFSQADLGGHLKRDRDIHLPHVTSYVPSSVQINQPA